MKRVYNFGAGPSMIPTPVLKKVQEELLDYQNSGMSIMEASHRSSLYMQVHQEAIELIKKLYNLPEDFEVLFMQGGASCQFALVPINLTLNNKAQYAITGVWSKKAINEAIKLGIDAKIVASSEDKNFNYIPQVNFSDDVDFCHITSNNTIYGTQYKNFPATKSALVVDASSDIFSYPIDWQKVDLLYAGAQKNAGPAGLTIVIIKKDLLNRVKQNTPTMLQYKTFANANSLYNTPPTFNIYMLNLILKWIDEQGGLEKIHQINQKKANLLYEAIDNSDGFYIGHAKKEDRSLMNVCFNIKEKSLEDDFIKKAQQNNIVGIKGHRSVGGLRASIYNAMPIEGVEFLVEFMKKFQKENS